ncbi:DUF1963 domain-containing protein [Rhizobium panacihumi]|uniref:DUF1963 domain-containing protein n=1 Tax=Rhizobium panacihumi TaxID=2008450 RepID=UPI003D78EB70
MAFADRLASSFRALRGLLAGGGDAAADNAPSPPLDANATFDKLKTLARPASLATVGGFRPPEDPTCSWFMRGCGLAGETVPEWRGEPMVPLLQIRVDELPFVPEQISHAALIVLFRAPSAPLTATPHGEGWLIREYTTLDGLQPFPAVEAPFKSFPVQWTRADDDSPGWEDAWSLLDLTSINRDEAAFDRFFDEFARYSATKVGGYPYEIQHGAGVEDFVFQVGSEDKAHWMWGDSGVAYFHRTEDGTWRFDCQFY